MNYKINVYACFLLVFCWLSGCQSVKLSRYHQNKLNRYVWKTQQHLTKTAQLKSLVDRRIRMNPHSVARDFYPVLDNVSKKLSKIHQKLRAQLNSQQALPPEEFRKIKRALKNTRQVLFKTNQHILQGSEQILESDILFEVGSAQLKAAGVVSLNQLAQHFKNNVLLLKNSEMQIKINITGYADEQGFVQGETPQQRQEKNRLLSLSRATTVKQYLGIILAKLFQNTSRQVWFNIQVEGKGEILPPKLNNPQKNDRRRRICSVSSYAVMPEVVIPSEHKKTRFKPKVYTMPSPTAPRKK